MLAALRKIFKNLSFCRSIYFRICIEYYLYSVHTWKHTDQIKCHFLECFTVPPVFIISLTAYNTEEYSIVSGQYSTWIEYCPYWVDIQEDTRQIKFRIIQYFI